MNYDTQDQNQSPNIAQDMTDQISALGKRGGKALFRKAGRFAGRMAVHAGKKMVAALGRAILPLLAKLAPIIIVIALVCIIIAFGWYMLYETRGAEGNYTFEPSYEENTLTYNQKKGYYSVTRLGGNNKMVLDFYKYFSNMAYYQIFEGDDTLQQTQKTENPIFDEYRQEELFTPSPNLLFVLDEYLHKGMMRYPEQLVQPIHYDPDTLSLKPLTDEKGNVVAESKEYGDDGFPTGGTIKSVHDYGIGSIYKYKKAQRTLTVEGKYVKKEVWDKDCECKEIVEIDEDFAYVMDGFPEDIWLMDKAVTFAMEVQLAYEERKIRYADLEDKVSEPNGNGNKVKYAEVKIRDEDGEVIDRIPLYKYRVGAVYETKPYPNPSKNVEKKYGLDYLKDYMYHYEAWPPKSVMQEFDFSSRVGEMLYTDLRVGDKTGTTEFMRLYQKFDVFKKYADMYGVDPYIMLAIAMQESGGRTDIEDGMFQIADPPSVRTVRARNVQTGQIDTFTIYNQSDRRDFEKSVRWATMYFANLMATFDGDPLKALQAYNFGPGTLNYIKENYPEAWSTTMWMNYREEARRHIGGQNTRSASVWCNPEMLDRPGVKSIWGDSCYIENVMRYYMGNKLEGLEGHDMDQKTWWQKMMDFVAAPFKKEYKEDEERFHFVHNMGVQEVEWTIRAAGTFEKNVLFSEIENSQDTLEFWENGFTTKTVGLSAKEFLELVPNARGYIPPLDPQSFPNLERLITSRFGFRTDPVTGKKGAFHAGIDLGVPIGTPVYAVADGIVEVAIGNRTHSKVSYGNYIKIKHEDGNSTLYGHLDKVFVKVGQTVKQGQLIGLSGNSGKSTGPHLHFEFWNGQERIDPYYIVVQPN